MTEYISAWMSHGQNFLMNSDVFVSALGSIHGPMTYVVYAGALIALMVAIHKHAASMVGHAVAGSLAGLVTSYIVSIAALHIPRLFSHGLSLANIPADVQSLMGALPLMTVVGYALPLILAGISGLAYSFVYRKIARTVTQRVS